MPIQNNPENLREDTARLRFNREANERETKEQAQSDSIEDSFKRVQQSSDDLEQSRYQQEVSDAKLENLEERNIRFTSVSVGQIAGFICFVLSVPAVFIIDNFLLGDTSREIAKGYTKILKTIIGNPEWIILSVIILFPLAYILLEIVVGYQFGVERTIGRVSFKTYSFAILAWLALPLIIIGFALVNSGLLDPNKSIGNATYWANIFRVSGQGLIAIVSHGFILWNGERIVESISYFIFKIRQFLLSRRINRFERQIVTARTNIESNFRNYYEAISRQNGGERISSSIPFGATTRKNINEVFGQEVIEEPPSSQSQDNQASVDESVEQGESNSTQSTQENQPNINQSLNQNGFVYHMNGEDEVRP